MLRKPRNARTERLTNWKFFVQIYLVRLFFLMKHTVVANTRYAVDRTHDVAMRNEHVVPVYEATTSRLPRRHPRLRQMDRWVSRLYPGSTEQIRVHWTVYLVCFLSLL